jgi:hypothetical protein
MSFQVKYMPQGLFCSTLLVELQPWALLVNVLGYSLVLMVEDTIVCRYLIKYFSKPLILHALFLVHRYFVAFKSFVIHHNPIFSHLMLNISAVGAALVRKFHFS